MTKLTFIHAADLHLDSPFAGMSNIPSLPFKRLKESTFQSAKNMFDLAIARSVDFVLLSGDLFDESNRSLKAQLFLRNQFLRLQTQGIDVFIIYGNHDHLGGEWTPIEWYLRMCTFFQAVHQVSNPTIEGAACCKYLWV